MPAPYPPGSVANGFLQRAFNARQPIGHMKLQKLVYLAHGYYLAFTDGTPLINEPFEAWDYGPVCRGLWSEFRNVGKASITALVTEFSWDDEISLTPIPAPTDDENVIRVLDYVHQAYGEWKPFDLSNLTHKEGWAWDRIRKADKFQLRNLDIPNDFIAEDFRPYLKRPSPST